MKEKTYQLSDLKINHFMKNLRLNERSAATIEKYGRDVRSFVGSLPGGRGVSRASVLAWKESLVKKGYAVRSVNSMLGAVNSLFRYLGWEELRVRQLRCQHEAFRRKEKELTRVEYSRLLEAARRKGDERLFLALQTICSTGIRVSELRFVTAEAVRKGCMAVTLKGKSRTVFLPKSLCVLLRQYAQKKGIQRGSVFLTRRGRPMERHQIWAGMKGLCMDAKVEGSKVFPHNLRHLFATVYHSVDKDLAKLADLLGHSSIETTRLYIATSGREHERKINRLRLVEAGMTAPAT